MSLAYRVTFSTAALALSLAAAPALAQDAAVPATPVAAPAAVPAPATPVVAAPTVDNATAGVRRVQESIDHADALAQVQERERASRPVALMLVGGAGLIVGSVIGGDAGTIVMVTSGVILLVGLYRFLR